MYKNENDVRKKYLSMGYNLNLIGKNEEATKF